MSEQTQTPSVPEAGEASDGSQAIELATQVQKNSPIPWHPGAVKYFTEKGVKM